MKQRLLIISDTKMLSNVTGDYAFGPVVRELDYFNFVEEIIWVGFADDYGKSFLPVTNSNVKLVILPKTGGKSIFDKLIVLCYLPKYFGVIFRYILQVNYIHVRSPSVPGMIANLYSFIFFKKQFWFKYAGNWVGSASISYRFQRFLLNHLPRNSKVTVNGKWDKSNYNVFNFENPCLSHADRLLGKQLLKTKILSEKINYCFVGNLDENKGVINIFSAFSKINNSNIGEIHIVGDGPLLDKCLIHAKAMDNNYIFHGALDVKGVQKIYKSCHFLILPSKSEGFPKVISEAMNFGCIPIVSNISCIGQYIKDDVNGFLIPTPINENLKFKIEESLKIDKKRFESIISSNWKLANIFTFDKYSENINDRIFTDL
jgi:glycosyltransferase involved in cell wall biosynthesis